MYNDAKRKERGGMGEGVPVQLFSSSLGLQTKGTSSSFDEVGISTSLFKLQTGGEPMVQTSQMSSSKLIHTPIGSGI